MCIKHKEYRYFKFRCKIHHLSPNFFWRFAVSDPKYWKIGRRRQILRTLESARILYRMDNHVKKVVMSLLQILLTFCRDKTPEQRNRRCRKLVLFSIWDISSYAIFWTILNKLMSGSRIVTKVAELYIHAKMVSQLMVGFLHKHDQSLAVLNFPDLFSNSFTG